MNFSPKTYFGFSPPSILPQLFSPSLLGNIHHDHSAPSFSLDGKLVLWSRWLRPDEGQPQCIMQMEFLDDKWQIPSIAPFSGTWNDGGPVFDFRGKYVYFYSTRPYKTKFPHHNNLWRVERKETGWGDPEKLPSPINTEKIQAAPSLALDGSLYYMSFQDGTIGEMAINYVKPIGKGQWTLPSVIESPFHQNAQDWLPGIAPDQSYLIFASNRSGGYGKDGAYDLYIAKRQVDDTWSIPVNLGSSINTAKSERFPGITRDGKYLFFVRGSRIYWVSTRALKI